ncbi:MAG: hypothetical protein LKF30_08750 [Sphingobium sp.]|nr:hypothetical protein [Sphingobium sp.]MCI2052970.1 hypothetical protein [Sphingobium sp.]
MDRLRDFPAEDRAQPGSHAAANRAAQEEAEFGELSDHEAQERADRGSPKRYAHLPALPLDR